MQGSLPGLFHASLCRAWAQRVPAVRFQGVGNLHREVLTGAPGPGVLCLRELCWGSWRAPACPALGPRSSISFQLKPLQQRES